MMTVVKECALLNFSNDFLYSISILVDQMDFLTEVCSLNFLNNFLSSLSVSIDRINLLTKLVIFYVRIITVKVSKAILCLNSSIPHLLSC